MARVVQGADGLYFETGADTGSGLDGRLVSARDVRGTLRAQVPRLGYLGEWLRTPQAAALLLLLPSPCWPWRPAARPGRRPAPAGAG